MAILGDTSAFVFTSVQVCHCCSCKKPIIKGTAHARVQASGYALKICVNCIYELNKKTQALFRKQRRKDEKAAGEIMTRLKYFDKGDFEITPKGK